MTQVITDIVTDVDGVFTDGKFVYTTEGKVSKTFGPHDADAIKIIKDVCGVRVTAISADKRGFPITSTRMQDMNVPLYLVSEKERLDWIGSNFNWDTVLFCGDGIYDAACLRKARWGMAPSNATTIAKDEADVVSKINGGEGFFLHVLAEIIGLNSIEEETLWERLHLND